MADGVGGFNTKTEVYLPIPMVEFTKTDDELALILAHEWAHVILDHFDLVDRIGMRRTEEIADCFGAMLAARAGYDPRAGAAVFSRMGAGSLGWTEALFGNGDHPGFGDRVAAVARVSAGAGPDTAKAYIEQACGARFP